MGLINHISIKKLISCILAVALLATANIPAYAVESKNSLTSGNCGEKIDWFINSDATLVLSGTGATDSNKPWFTLNNDIQKIVVEDGITELKGGQFSSCENITDVVFSSTVTNLGACISSEMNYLTDIWIYSENVINNFYGNGSAYPKPGSGTKWHVYKGTTTETSLREGLKLTDEDFEYITDEKFPKIENRKAVDIPEVTETSGPCGLLSTYSWDEDTKTLTFEGSGGITITEYYQKFADKTENVVIDKSNITSICDSAFGLIESISTDALFPKLSKVSFPTTLKVIGDYAFCQTALTSIDLPEGLETIGWYAFNHTPLTGDLVLPKTINLIGQAAFAHTNITSIDLHEEMTIGGNAFCGCNSLTNVTIPNNLTYLTSSQKNMARENGAFLECEKLKTVTINGGGLVYLGLGNSTENGIGGDLFKDCISLKEVIIKADNIEYVEKATFNASGNQESGTFDADNNITFYIYKDSTTEATLRGAGYLTDTNVVYIANKTVLEGAVKSAEDMDVSQYTPESVDALNKAIEAGKAVIANETATQENADNAVKAIEDAIAGLEVMQKGSISGTITVPGVDTEVTVTVVNADGEIIDEEMTTDGKYTVSDLEDGEYTIIVTAENCVPRSYDVTVADGDATLDAEIHLKGDINGDGEITMADVGLANAHARGTAKLEDYDFVVADVTGDGEVTTADVGAINSHVQSVRALW